MFKGTVLRKPQSQIPLMIDTLEEYISDIKIGKQFDLIEEFGGVMLDIILAILFGTNFYKKVGKVNYKKKNGYFKKMKFEEGLGRIQKDLVENGENLTTALFPWVNLDSKIEPFKRDKENVSELYRVLYNFCQTKGK